MGAEFPSLSKMHQHNAATAILIFTYLTIPLVHAGSLMNAT